MRRAAALLLLFGACGGEDEQVAPGAALPEPPAEPRITRGAPAASVLDYFGPAEAAIPLVPERIDEPEPQPPPPPPEGGAFIGEACESDRDCGFPNGVCLQDSFPRGMCSSSCDRLCPDQDGSPTTFCADLAMLPREARNRLSVGGCLSRCDYGLFPNTGCRQGYGCVEKARANEPATERMVCLPGEGGGTSTCLAELAAMDVRFEPTRIADRHPEGHPNLTCHVEDPVILHPPIHGVAVAYYDGTPSRNLTAACKMAKALVRTIDDVKARGAVKLYHLGTYNCRPISGTSRLSRHGMGDAIDIQGFELADGTRYTLERNWEHDTTMPRAAGARFLYQAAQSWHRSHTWNIILTPNYNAAHDNHFHVDLTPGSDFLQFTGEDGYYFGPAPYDD